MFGLGFGELLVLVFLAVIFIKPEDLPAMTRTVARIVGLLRGHMREAERMIDDLKDMKEEPPPKPPVSAPQQPATPPVQEPARTESGRDARAAGTTPPESRPS